MSQRRRTKKIIIQEDLKARIVSGELRPGDLFPNIRTLAQKFGISPRTAAVIIHDLGEEGLLEISPGRRTRICLSGEWERQSVFPKPVAVVSSEPELLPFVAWREWLWRNIQTRLQREGLRTEALTDGMPEDSGMLRKYSAVVFADERVPPSKWESLRKAGLPCVRLSFSRPHPDTLFLDYRSALDRAALFLGKRRCRRLVMLASCEREAKYALNWFTELGIVKTLQDYNVEEYGFQRVTVSSGTSSGWTKVHEINLNTKVKTAYLLSCSSYIPRLMEILHKGKMSLGADYEIVSLSKVPGESAPGGSIDPRCDMVAERMVDILLRGARSGESQFGQIVTAEFSS